MDFVLPASRKEATVELLPLLLPTLLFVIFSFALAFAFFFYSIFPLLR